MPKQNNKGFDQKTVTKKSLADGYRKGEDYKKKKEAKKMLDRARRKAKLESAQRKGNYAKYQY